MHFALLGDHPDGLDFACALVESGRHRLAVYVGGAAGAEQLRRRGVEFRREGDLEEALSDPNVAAVIVAGRPGDRPAQLRRALQAERHVLCVHPADQSPDVAYEAAMLQGDTKQILLPLLADALHPALARLAEVVRQEEDLPVPEETAITPVPRHGVHRDRPSLVLIELEHCATETPLLEADTPGNRSGIPGWDILRGLGGEIVEVMAFAPSEELAPEDPLQLSGRFESGALFQMSLVPNRPEARWRLTATTRQSRAELVFPQGWPGPARLTWHDAQGTPQDEQWETWHPWPVLVEIFEQALSAYPGMPSRAPALAAGTSEQITAAPLPRQAPVAARGPVLTWQHEIRCLELDEAARRSVERRRASTLDYQEATEEAGFKGTMTLVGCGLLWASLVLLVLSRWIPVLGWGIAPLFALFLVLQLFRWVVPRRESGTTKNPGEPDRIGACRRNRNGG
jgi:predicted dehydrogenase